MGSRLDVEQLGGQMKNRNNDADIMLG